MSKKSDGEPTLSPGVLTLQETLKALDHLIDIPLTISVELGSTKQKVRDVLGYQIGSVLELNKLVGEPMEVYINGMLTARGETVVVNDRFGLRVTDVIDPLEVVRFEM